jgi:hypothetical protein
VEWDQRKDKAVEGGACKDTEITVILRERIKG